MYYCFSLVLINYQVTEPGLVSCSPPQTCLYQSVPSIWLNSSASSAGGQDGHQEVIVHPGLVTLHLETLLGRFTLEQVDA